MALTLFTPFRDAWLLHLDEHLVVVNKPAGVSTHAADPARLDDLVSRVKAWRAALTGEDPAKVYLGVHQRLDRDTSGVIVFARTAQANKALAPAFEGRAVEKRYLALATLPPNAPKERTLTHDVAPGDDDRMVALPPGRGGKTAKRAVTHVRVARRVGDRALLEVTPETGRTHQIRVQCAAAGMPLAGDLTYGGPPAPRLMLHASSLTIPDPATGRARTFTAPTPALFDAWLRDRPDPRDIRERLRDAADRRWFLARDPAVTAFRLAHDGDGIAGHAVDVYGEHAVVHAFDGAIDDALLDALTEAGFAGVYAKFRPKQANTLVDTRRDEVAPPHAVRGVDAPESFTITEHGLRYLVKLGDGLSTGIFLDQRENRRRVRALSEGRSVLNLFAYTGPFTVAAAAGGASRTVTVDVSRASLDRARQNLAENGLDDAKHSMVVNDVFAWLRGALARKERFDLVIADPPSYSNARGSRWSSESDWKKLAQDLFTLLTPGGALLACSNHKGVPRMRFRRHLHEAARAAGREVTQMKDLPAPEDFPPAPGAEPHLKAVLVTVR